MQAGTTRDFVAQAKTRPITEDRQKEFAINRTQAQLKCARADAAALVAEVWDLPEDQLRTRSAQHGTDAPERAAEYQKPIA